MKRILLVLLVLSSYPGLAQDLTTDFNVIKATTEELYEKLESNNLPPRLEIDVRNDLAFRLRNSNYNEALKFAADALDMAKAIEYDKGVSDANMRLGTVQDRLGNYNQAIQYYNITLRYRLENGLASPAASTYNSIGIVNKKLGRFEEAIRSYEKGLDLVSRPSKLQAKLYNNKAISMRYLGRYEEALVHFDSSLQVKELFDDSVGMANTYLDLAQMNTRLGDYDRAEELIDNAKSIYTKSQKENKVALCHVGFGDLEFAKGRYPQARDQYKRALSFQENLTEDLIIKLNQNLGSTYLHEGEADVAIKYYRSTLDRVSSQEIQNSYISASLLYNLGKAYQKKEDYVRASEFSKKALQLIDNASDFDLQLRSNIYLQLSDLYAIDGVYDQALFMSRRADSLWSQAVDGKFMAIHERQSLTEQNLNERIDIGKLQLIAEKKDRANQTARFMLVLLIIVFTAVIAVAWNQNKRKKERQQAEEEIDTLLEVQAIQAQDAHLKGQDQERERIAQDLHDGLGNTLATVKLHFANLDEKLDAIQQESRDQYKKANALLDEACKEVRRISHDMKARELTNGGLSAQLGTMLSAIKESRQIEVELNLFRFEDRLPSLTEINIYRIIQELVSNVLKHAKATRLIVALTKFEHLINVQVEDNGRGFLPGELNDKSGMGLENVRSRVKVLGGEINIDSVIDRGTAVSVDIPLDISNIPENQY